MYSHLWDCGSDHSLFDCPHYPTSNVRVITAFDRHVDDALALAESVNRHPSGRAR